MKKKIEEEVFTLILCGKIQAKDGEEEEVAAINLLVKSAEVCPDTLWFAIFEAFSYENTGMAIPAIAAFLSSKNQDAFNENIKMHLIDILETLNPVNLLELTEYIKSRMFGKGLGSRSQKIIRRSMERWEAELLREYSILYPEELHSLIRIIHPRMSGIKGDIIKLLVENR